MNKNFNKKNTTFSEVVVCMQLSGHFVLAITCFLISTMTNLKAERFQGADV